MKFQPDSHTHQSIHGYGAGWIAVNNEKITKSVILTSDGLRQAWDCTHFDALTPAHFAKLANFDCEVAIFGSGARMHFPPTEWLRPLIAKNVGLECMDTPAACRTYNILAGEGRRVLVALIIENGDLIK